MYDTRVAIRETRVQIYTRDEMTILVYNTRYAVGKSHVCTRFSYRQSHVCTRVAYRQSRVQQLTHGKVKMASWMDSECIS